MSNQTVCPLCGQSNDPAQVNCQQCGAHLRQAAVVAELSRRLEALEQALTGRPALAAAAPPPPLKPVTAPAPPAAPPKPAFELPDYLRQSEFWLNKIGIGLLLLSVAFLFKFSIDQGWLTPPVRALAGLGLGTVLLVFGFRLYDKRLQFSRVLLGGSIGTYYITGFATYQLLELISYPVAFAFMCLVTLLAFALALRQNEAMLSLIGAVGGLATPFLLYTGQGSLVGLMVYTIILLAGIGAIYAFKGWQLLLWVTTAGAWLIFIISVIDLPGDTATARADRWAAQAGLLFGWLILWAIPTLRRVAREKRWLRLAPPKLGFADNYIPAGLQTVFDGQLYLLPGSTALVTLLLTWEIWKLNDTAAGLVALIGAGIFGLAGVGLAGLRLDKTLADSHLLTGALLLALALGQFFEADMLFLTWTLEAVALHLLSRRLSSVVVEVVAHAFSAVIGLWLLARLLEGETAPPFLNAPALADLLFIGASFALTLGRYQHQLFKIGYRVAAHVLLLGWFWRELAPLSEGQGLVSTAWGVYTVILLILALRLRLTHLRAIAMTTLFVLVGKLLVVDLAELAAIWRILLFFGFGGAFLILSYFSRKLWRAPEEVSPGGAAAESKVGIS